MLEEFNDVRNLPKICEDLLLGIDFIGPINICSGTAHSLRHVLEIMSWKTGQGVKVVVDDNFVLENGPLEIRGDKFSLTSTVSKSDFIQIEETLGWMDESSRL